MSRKCELSGKAVQYGNNVSHSQRKTRRRFEPNMRSNKFSSNVMGQEFRFRVSMSCLRTVEKFGDFDRFMIESCDDNLSIRAKMVKRKIKAKMAAQRSILQTTAI